MTPLPPMGLAATCVALALLVCPTLTRAADRAPEALSVVLAGDVQHGRYRFKRWVTHTADEGLGDVARLWQGADLTMVNLENPLTDRDPPDILRLTERPWRNIRLRGPTTAARDLARSGVQVATVANNHTLDCGRWGVADTLAALGEAGVATAGVSLDGDPLTPTVIEVGSVPAYIFAATRTSNRRVDGPSPLALLSHAQMQEDLVARVHEVAGQRPDALILVSLHWGTEWSFSHDPPQTRIAHALIDAGAHIIVGHHPHLVQPVEIYRNGLILYSIGNLLFDQPSVSARHSAIARATLRRGSAGWQVDGVDLHAIYRDLRRPGPEIAAPEPRWNVLERVRKKSLQTTGTAFLWNEDHLRWRRPEVLAASDRDPDKPSRR